MTTDLPLGKLFTPFQAKSLELQNRTVMAPMTRTFSPNHVPGENVAEYYRKRAEGGVGLIITEGTFIPHAGANGYPNVPACYGDEAMAGWKKVVDAVHAAGGKIAPQIWHVGAVRKQGVGPEAEAPAFSPSGLFKPGAPNGVAMSKEDINDAINAYAQAAKNAKDVGFDAVEIHGAHGYLIDQFFWEGTNQRTDEYGGSLENRTRFGVEVTKAVREAVGEDFTIIFRFSQWKQQDYEAKLAQNPEELERFLSLLSDAGVDIFHASTRRFWLPEFEGSDLNLAGWTKKITGKPCITVGSVGLDSDFVGESNPDKVRIQANTPYRNTGSVGLDSDFVGESNPDMRQGAAPASIDNLVERLEREEFDLVAIGRALLVDSEWVSKIKNGRDSELKPFTKDALKTLA